MTPHLRDSLRRPALALVFALVFAATPKLAAAAVPPGTPDPGQVLAVSRAAVVHMSDMARQATLRSPAPGLPARVWLPTDEMNEMDIEPGAAAVGPAVPRMPLLKLPAQPLVASPLPTTSFKGLDDIPMADSSYIVIPPDVSGGVGPTRVMNSFNNNYRIQDKVTGANVVTLGTATFWNPVITNKALLSQLTDPRTTYDPINNVWIVAMQTVNNPGQVLFGVSQTSDPAGSWFLYSFQFSGSYLLDYPELGFNKNWICVTINRYTSGGSFSRGVAIVANYAQARAGTLSSVTAFDPGGGGVRFCASPAVTLSATEDTLFVPTHLSSAGATYQVDVITGTPSAPVYTSGSTQTRPGGGWTQPSGNLLPQSAPNSGVSACGATPCPIEVQDSQIRSDAVYRVDSTTGRAYLYYTQTIQLSGPTRTAVQWTKLTAAGGGTSPAFADGGRIDDPTATNWYAFAHIAVNGQGDFIVGYSRFGPTFHPSAAYSWHDHADGLGTMRDPQIYKAGEDYYHKTFSTTTGRNRWGDFTTAAIDPSDDRTLWVLQEYGQTRNTTDDGNTGSNASKWSTFWAGVTPAAPTFTINASAGANGSISPNGAVSVASGASQGFTITPSACFHVADVLVDGSSVGAVTSYAFTNVLSNHTISASFAINTYTIDASAGAGGSIGPSGTVGVNCGADQGFTITPGVCNKIADVLVDGVSVGAVTNYTFTNVQAHHTIAASFAVKTFTITASAGANGSISPSGAVGVNCGADQGFTITPDAGHHVAGVLVDGVDVGPMTTYTFINVQANHTIAASMDTDSFTVAVTIAGLGSVAKSPDQPKYAFGSSVTLTATPTAGWGFVGWTGDVTSSTNPLPLTISHAFSLTATFADTTAPVVQQLTPAPAATVNIGTTTNLTWSSSDNVAVTAIDLLLSRTGVAGPYDSLATGIANTGTYSWPVVGPPTSDAFLKVVAHDAAGLTASDANDAAFTIADVTGVDGALPKDFAFSRLWPQPTHGDARIQFALPRSAAVRLTVNDVQGRETAVLTDGVWDAGVHEVVWRGASARPGLYFVRLKVPGRMFVRRLVRMN